MNTIPKFDQPTVTDEQLKAIIESRLLIGISEGVVKDPVLKLALILKEEREKNQQLTNQVASLEVVSIPKRRAA